MPRKANTIIAIDGYAAAGKGTLAKDLAKHLNFLYIDTGAMYRAITLALMNQGLIIKQLDEDKSINNICNFVKLQKISFIVIEGKYITLLNGKNVEDEIRSFEVSENVSKVSTWACVRNHLVNQQREIGKNNSVIMDGRDIGTVVFPNAEYKFFVITDAKTRAERRYLQLKNEKDAPTIEEILNNIKSRDFTDSNRTIAPLKQANDAILVDNTHMNREEQFQFALKRLTIKN